MFSVRIPSGLEERQQGRERERERENDEEQAIFPSRTT